MLFHKRECVDPDYHESTEFNYLMPRYYSVIVFTYGNKTYHYFPSRNGHLEFAIVECNCMDISEKKETPSFQLLQDKTMKFIDLFLFSWPISNPPANFVALTSKYVENLTTSYHLHWFETIFSSWVMTLAA